MQFVHLLMVPECSLINLSNSSKASLQNLPLEVHFCSKQNEEPALSPLLDLLPYALVYNEPAINETRLALHVDCSIYMYDIVVRLKEVYMRNYSQL